MTKYFIFYFNLILLTSIFSDNYIKAQSIQLNKKMVSPERGRMALFGGGLFGSNPYLMAKNLTDSFEAAGGVYVFKYIGNDSLNFVQKIVSDDINSGDIFGNSYSVSGDFAIIGAERDDEDSLGNNNLINSGSAYIFKLDSIAGKWVQFQKIVAKDRELGDFFGRNVSIEGEYAAVSNYRYKVGESESVYIYKYNKEIDKWLFIQKISGFGNSISFYDSCLIIVNPMIAVQDPFWPGTVMSPVRYIYHGEMNLFYLNSVGQWKCEDIQS